MKAIYKNLDKIIFKFDYRKVDPGTINFVSLR